MKLVRNGVLVLVVLLVVLIGVGFFYVPSLVRAGTETVSTDVMGAQTTVTSADVSFSKGEVALNEYTVKNPEGFAKPTFVQIGQIRVQASVSDLRKDPVEVGELVIDRPELTVEQSGAGTNLQAIMEHLQKKPGSRWKIQKLIVKGGKVNFSLPLLQKEVSVDAPDITLTNLTNKDGGPAMMGDVIRQVLQEMVGATVEKGGLPGDFKDQLGKVANLGQLKEQAQAIQDQAHKAVEDAANKAKGALEGLFGGGKK